MNIAATLPPAMDEDTEQLIDVVRKFVNERLFPKSKSCRRRHHPNRNRQEMREMGLFRVFPNQWGIGLNA